MFLVDAPFPPGTIGIISHELSRYSDFSISVVRLKAPQRSGLYWNKGVEIAVGMNNIVRHMEGEWVFILGDDHTFHGDILLALLEDDVDIVVPLCASRGFPFGPVLYTEQNDTYYHMGWDNIPKNTVFEVAGAGSAGMLIKKRVLDALGEPWFVAGQNDATTVGEDLTFCRRARKLGFKVHADSRYSIGHMTPATIWPTMSKDRIVPMSNFNGDETRWVRLDEMITQVPAPQVLSPNLLED